jgi:hypothetical protein
MSQVAIRFPPSIRGILVEGLVRQETIRIYTVLLAEPSPPGLRVDLPGPQVAGPVRVHWWRVSASQRIREHANLPSTPSRMIQPWTCMWSIGV